MSLDAKTRAIVREANEWLVRMTDAEAASQDEARFAAWLRQSPVHVREYLRAEAVYEAVGEVDAERRIDVEALLAADAGNVVAMEQPAADGGEAGRSKSARHPVPDSGGRAPVSRVNEPLQAKQATWRRAGLAVAALVVGVVGASLYLQNVRGDVYTTARGEQRRVVLEDGSVVDMNTDTALSVRMADDGRHVELVKGEALFTVAKDPGRPFLVDGDIASVRALGTQFNVYRQVDQVLVTVLEGRVAVEGETPRRGLDGDVEVAMIDKPIVELAAGDQAAVARQAPIRKAPANTEKTIAWRERRLIFENQPLSEVVAEFNRYNRRQLVIQDMNLANERVSAVFDADQPEALVRFLTRNSPVQAIDSGDQRLILRADE